MAVSKLRLLCIYSKCWFIWHWMFWKAVLTGNYRGPLHFAISQPINMVYIYICVCVCVSVRACTRACVWVGGGYPFMYTVTVFFTEYVCYKLERHLPSHCHLLLPSCIGFVFIFNFLVNQWHTGKHPRNIVLFRQL
jgi:hypothetical protein